MEQPILPFAQSLILCDGYEVRDEEKIDLIGTFDKIQATHYPHIHESFGVIARLTGGRGTITTFVDIRVARTLELVQCTASKQFTIPTRDTVVLLVNGFEDISFSRPGIYLVELYCENTPIADFRLLLEQVEEGAQGEEP